MRQQPHTSHHRNIILALKMAGIPSMNSLHSLYNFFDPPWVLAQLSRIQSRVGKEQFPTVATTMLPSAASLRRYRDFPAVVISGLLFVYSHSKIFIYFLWIFLFPMLSEWTFYISHPFIFRLVSPKGFKIDFARNPFLDLLHIFSVSSNSFLHPF